MTQARREPKCTAADAEWFSHAIVGMRSEAKRELGSEYAPLVELAKTALRTEAARHGVGILTAFRDLSVPLLPAKETTKIRVLGAAVVEIYEEGYRATPI